MKKKNIKIVRKSIYAKVDIENGQKFSTNNLKICRPAFGYPPSYLYKLVGKRSNKKYKKNQLIK